MSANTSSRETDHSISAKRIHELDQDELANYWVSGQSQFKDHRWAFTNPTPGSKKNSSILNWGMVLYDGSSLTERQHEKRLHWARVLMLTMLKVPSRGQPPAPGSMCGHQQCFKWLLSWMSEQAYHHPSELTPQVIDYYIEDLPRFMVSHSTEEELTPAVVRRALDVLGCLWLQRGAMRKMGIGTLSQDPFFRKGIPSVAEEIAGKGIGWIQPIPDEVAVPMFNKALWFLGQPAEDVLRLVEIHEALDGEKDTQRKYRFNKSLRAFEFNAALGELTPWHCPLAEVEPTRSRIRDITPANTALKLARNLLGACVLIAQGLSGMRISEICGLKAGMDPTTGLPTNVRMETSITGLYEWFVVRSQLSKTVEGPPIDVDWVLGMRPKGSNTLPPAVRALQILNRLFSPWYPAAVTDRLILGWGAHIALSRSSSKLGGIASDTLRKAMKEFIADWVDLSALPDESQHKSSDNDLVVWRTSKGSVFNTHMLRKSWASYTLAVNPLLLGAIQMQFHHLSLAMTEGGYVGRNPLQVEALDSVSRQKRNSMIFELVTGRSALAGRMGQQLEEATSTLKKALKGLPTSTQWRQVVEWADKNDLHLFFANHATCCPTRASEMRCHEVSNTPSLIRHRPNFSTREPSLCAGCACAIMDQSHEPFWSERYVSSRIAVRQAETMGTVGQFQIIAERAEQASKILRKFGANIASLDAQVDEKLKRRHAQA